jgi:hypothetical protein
VLINAILFGVSSMFCTFFVAGTFFGLDLGHAVDFDGAATACSDFSTAAGIVEAAVRATATPEVRRRSVTDACGILAGDPKSIFILQYKCY